MENKEETHPPPTLNTQLAGGDGEIASWSQESENFEHFWKVLIIIKSPRLSKHRVVAVIAGVCASLANLAHTRHWYHLADCKMCEIVKIRDTAWALQTYKP